MSAPLTVGRIDATFALRVSDTEALRECNVFAAQGKVIRMCRQQLPSQYLLLHIL